MNKDSERDKDRDKISNANIGVSNLNNPFLVTPFQLLSGLAKQTAVSDNSSTLSSLILNLSTMIDFTTYSIYVSTLYPIDKTISIKSNTLNVSGTSNFNYISTVTLSTNTLITKTITFTTLKGSIINATTINASTINITSGITPGITFPTPTDCITIQIGGIPYYIPALLVP